MLLKGSNKIMTFQSGKGTAKKIRVRHGFPCLMDPKRKREKLF